MNIAIIGSRSFNDYELLRNIISFNKDDIIISGGAIGADSLAKKFANDNNLELIEYFPNWSLYGKSAGMIRNKDIVSNSDIIYAFWDGESKGTLNSISLAKQLNKDCIVTYFNIKNNEFF